MGYDNEIVLAFLDEVDEYIPQLRQHLATLTTKMKAREPLEECYRLAHSIKGSAAMLELEELRQQGWVIEQTLFPIYEKKEHLTPAILLDVNARVDKIEALVEQSRRNLLEPVVPVVPDIPSLTQTSDAEDSHLRSLGTLEFPPDTIHPVFDLEEPENPVIENVTTEPGHVLSRFKPVQPAATMFEPELRQDFGLQANSAFKVESLEDLIREFQQDVSSDAPLEPLPDLDLAGPAIPPIKAIPEPPPVEPTAPPKTWDNAPLFDLVFSDFDLDQLGLPEIEVAPPEVEAAKVGETETVTADPANFPYPYPAFQPQQNAPGDSGSLLSFEEGDFSGLVDNKPYSPDYSHSPHHIDPSLPNWMTDPLPSPSAETHEVGLDEILFTGTVDQHVDRLQGEIRPHMTGDLSTSATFEMPAFELGDSDLLAHLAGDLPDQSQLQRFETMLPPQAYPAEGAGYEEASHLFSGLEVPVSRELAEPVVAQPPEEEMPSTIGLSAEEEAEIEAAIAAMERGDLGDLDNLSDEEAAALAAFGEDQGDLADFGFDPGPLFLAEAKADLDKLVELVGEFGPESIEDGSCEKITQLASTMRKAAEMMGLSLVARELNTLETLGGMLAGGEMPVEDSTVAMVQSALEDLLFLLEPYQEGAQALLAPPPAETEPDEAPEETEELESPLEPAFPLPSISRSVPVSQEPRPVDAGTEVDAELAEVFASEAEEHIQALDKRLVALEREPGNRELVREIRRTAHTLKGSAAMMNFNIISQTAHLMEDLLDRLFDGSLQVDGEVVDLLFQTFTAIEGNVRAISNGKPDNSNLLEELRPHYAELLGLEEMEGELAGGAFIFGADELATEAPTPPGLHTVQEEEVRALESSLGEDITPERAAAIRGGTGLLSTTAPVSGEDLDIRIPIRRLNEMMNQVGEMVINRTMLEQRSQIFNRSVEEFNLSLRRLQRLARELETRYEVELLKSTPIVAGGETQPAYGYQGGNGKTREDAYAGEFDTLEMDRYTEFHQLSREMSETVSDLTTIQRELDNLRDEYETVTVQQGRISDDLQDKLVRVRLVPLSNMTPRLYRTVRTISLSEGKDVQFLVSGDSTQVDKTIFEEIADPLLHLIRNAIDHGIEPPEVRQMMGKPTQGKITFSARSEGTQVIIEIKDDGAGIDPDVLLMKGIEKGFVQQGDELSLDEIYDLIFLPGFSTSQTISEVSGRGVGMDVVKSNITSLRGTLELLSEIGQGTTFIIRLPNTLTITHAVLTTCQGFTYAVPLAAVEHTTRLEAGVVGTYNGHQYFRLEGENLPLVNLSDMLQLPPRLHRITGEEEQEQNRAERPVLIIGGSDRCALRVDALVGQQEIVIKDLGTHLKARPGLLGSTILGNGQVILILNINELLRLSGVRATSNALLGAGPQKRSVGGTSILSERGGGRRGGTGVLGRPVGTGALTPAAEVFRRRRAPLVQVVDDSLSIRRLLSGILEKAGFRVRTSKDGQEALETVQQQSPPDIFIMDIEMPRMDGYELTTILKNSPLYRDIPVVMLTSRAGAKHRQKAEEVGANGFLVKPYKDEELLSIVSTLLMKANRAGSEV